MPRPDISGSTPRSGEKMRVLIVNSTLHIGGAEQVAANLATHLDRDRFEVTACYLKENGTVGAQMARDGVDLVPVPGHRKGRDYLTAFKLRRLVRQRRIQLIHTHDVHSFVDGCICRLSTAGLRHVHTFHFGNYPNVPQRYARLEKLLWRVPDRLVAVGHAQAAAISAMYRIPRPRLEVVWNGARSQEAEIAPEIAQLLRGIDVPVIASISTLIPQKGLSDLLHAAALLKNRGYRYLLLIAGEGRLRTELESLSGTLGLGEHVRFLGWVKEASRRILPACDIFVQSSHWEAMSVVVIEAMAAQKPIVATSVGENSQVLVDGETGLLVPARAPEKLADALARVIENPQLRQRLGQAAKARYDARLTVDHMIRSHEELYTSAIGSISVTRT